jgi:acyl-CoA reductase-like NAD-dependent aldehyde dehydrogenase
LSAATWLQADNTSLQNADQSVQASLAQSNQARRNYYATAREKGKDSPEAKAAQANYQAARQDWQQKVQARRRLRQQARRQMDQNRNRGGQPFGAGHHGGRGL